MKKIVIPVDRLKKLYLDQHLSTFEIAQLFNCNRQTIANKLKLFDIPRHSPSKARIKYDIRKDFNGSLEEKAYLLSFRLGDLNVYKPFYQTSETIVIRCHTTNIVQVNLIEELFNNYGRITTSKGKHGYTINCYLNMSFDFLLPKSDFVEEWIGKSQSTSLAFIAGYIDAEGTFQINQGRGRFVLSVCDKNILYWIHNRLIEYNIKSIYKRVSEKGTKSIGKYVFSNDVWRININESNSLFEFIKMIIPFLKHEKRVADMQIVGANIINRKKRGTI